MAQSQYKWQSDGMIWTNGTAWHSTELVTRRRWFVCWSVVTFCGSRQPDQLVWLWNGPQKMTEGELEDQKEMTRYTERFGDDGCVLEWCKRDCQRMAAIVPDGDNSSPDAPLGTGGTKSKYYDIRLRNGLVLKKARTLGVIRTNISIRAYFSRGRRLSYLCPKHISTVPKKLLF